MKYLVFSLIIVLLAAPAGGQALAQHAGSGHKGGHGDSHGMHSGPPSTILEREHDVGEKVFRAAEREAAYIAEHRAVRAERVSMMVDFFRNFLDRCHHAKEEDHYFKMLREEGFRDTTLIRDLLEEHERGRKLIGRIDSALPSAADGDSESVTEVRDALREYVAMMYEHVDKENNNLFPRGNGVLNDEQQERLTAAFHHLESEELGEGFHEKYLKLVDRLTR